MNIKKTAIAVLCAVLLFVSGIVPNAFADWYDDISSGTYVEIKGKNFVADTFHGVKALYNEGGPTLYCNELVIRFYKEAYGLDISAGTSGISMKSEGYKFVTPSDPKPGDVVYVSKAMRGTSDHWAIVKYNNGDHLVLFEQNVVNGGKAGVERKLKYPSDSYKLYTPVSTGEKPAPVLKGASDKPTTQSTTEKTTVTTTEKTTVTTIKPTTITTKPTTTTTTVPTTTKLTTTTTKPTTTKSTTAKVTTTKPSTTAVTTSAAASEVQTALSVTETETFAVTFLSVEITENYHSAIQDSTTEAVEETESSPAGKIALGVICAVLVMGIAALVVLIIKKK